MVTWARKKYFQLAKGFYGRTKSTIRAAVPRVEKSLQYAYRDRRTRRREVRKHWIRVISGGVSEHSINYSRFINGLNYYSNVELDRKILANLAEHEPYSFKAVVDEVKLKMGFRPTKKTTDETLLEAYAKGMILDVLPNPNKKEVQHEFKWALSEEEFKKELEEAKQSAKKK
mmetsp:Transcript_16208/g.18603  ORF Transcript_16208/g.18603 Transcript_16208/m.18603 type:complete len:172 (-) Transcript_16208:76-591(-)